MNIQGVEILTQKTLYSSNWLGIICLIITFFSSTMLLYISVEDSNKGAGIASCFILPLFILSLILTTITNCQTILNYPAKIQYEIEIIDENAWKELGPNYTIKEKIYPNKEIYLIEGDYVE